METSWLKAAGKLPAGLLGMLALVAGIEHYFGSQDKFSRLEAHDWKTATRSARGSS